MPRTPDERYIADIRLAIEIGGSDDDIADGRLNAVLDFLMERTSKSTFRRLPGRPKVTYGDVASEPTPV